MVGISCVEEMGLPVPGGEDDRALCCNGGLEVLHAFNGERARAVDQLGIERKDPAKEAGD